MKPVTAPSVKFTYEDFLNFPHDGKRHEIIDGDHYVTPSPNTKHQTVCLNLTVLLATYLKHHPIGAVFAAPFDVVFSDLDVVEPDLLSSWRFSRLARARPTRSPNGSCTNALTSKSTGWSIPSWRRSRCIVAATEALRARRS